MDQAELLQDLALKLDLANMELTTIDNVLARRPALAGLKHRAEKIEHACDVNSYLVKLLGTLHQHFVGLAAYLETCASDVIIDNLPTTIADLHQKQKMIEDARTEAERP